MYTEGEMQTVGALTARAAVSQPAVTKHLGVLKQAPDLTEAILDGHQRPS
jgi:DNA-binding transcriptional ArsR family regulator